MVMQILLLAKYLELADWNDGPGNLVSISGHAIPKTLKNGTWYLLA